MKKAVSILFAALILISGMHLSIATHICGGEVAAVKWSFSSKKADCGMETSKSGCPAHNGIASNCCHNQIAYFTVDNNYKPSTFQVKDVVKKVSQVFAVPVNVFSTSLIYPVSSYANVSPPDKSIANAVSLADICVFRI